MECRNKNLPKIKINVNTVMVISLPLEFQEPNPYEQLLFL